MAPATSPYPERVLPRSLVLRAGAAVAVLTIAVAGLTLAATSQAEVTHPDDAEPARATAAAAAAATEPAAKPRRDPRTTRGLFVDPLMPAFQRGGIYRDRIGSKAQAFWVIPEAYPTEVVQTKVREYVERADAARKTPVLTVYGIPGRDCGQYSSGNPLTSAPAYRAWIRQAARGLRGTKPLVVLEPDALPFFSSSVNVCPTKPAGWQAMLRFATRTLTKAGAWVYLDAGHSNWTPHETRPQVLKQAGVRWARGISVNVSNFRSTATEKAYAATMLRGLRALGIRGKRYVVDTSRNGAAGGPQDGQVINPPWARLGKPPRLVFKGAFDGTLWIKHPGESDGYENGGPSSGQWCDLLADRLLGLPETGTCG